MDRKLHSIRSMIYTVLVCMVIATNIQNLIRMLKRLFRMYLLSSGPIKKPSGTKIQFCIFCSGLPAIS